MPKLLTAPPTDIVFGDDIVVPAEITKLLLIYQAIAPENILAEVNTQVFRMYKIILFTLPLLEKLPLTPNLLELPIRIPLLLKFLTKLVVKLNEIPCPALIVTSSSASGMPSASVPDVIVHVAGALQVPEDTLENVAEEILFKPTRVKNKRVYSFFMGNKI
jgi:hypothetical protein